jgi:stringent starvation protein B
MRVEVPETSKLAKREVMAALLERSEARVHFDARRPGVQLPPRLLGDGHVRLDYSYGFTPPIPDLKLTDTGIQATLSFSRQPFVTFVPWSAVYLIADYEGNGAVWPEDIPADLREEGEADAEAVRPVEPPPEPTPTPPKKPRPSHLKLVK